MLKRESSIPAPSVSPAKRAVNRIDTQCATFSLEPRAFSLFALRHAPSPMRLSAANTHLFLPEGHDTHCGDGSSAQ
jgi:hypothetical protein